MLLSTTKSQGKSTTSIRFCEMMCVYNVHEYTYMCEHFSSINYVPHQSYPYMEYDKLTLNVWTITITHIPVA